MSIGHAIVGILLLVASFSGESTCAFALYVAGTVSVLFASYGLYELGSYDSVNLGPGVLLRSGEYFHIALGLTMLLFGKLNTARKQLFHE